MRSRKVRKATKEYRKGKIKDTKKAQIYLYIYLLTNIYPATEKDIYLITCIIV